MMVLWNLSIFLEKFFLKMRYFLSLFTLSMHVQQVVSQTRMHIIVILDHVELTTVEKMLSKH